MEAMDAGQQERTGQVWYELIELTNEIDRAESTVGRLQNKTQPVTRTSEPVGLEAVALHRDTLSGPPQLVEKTLEVDPTVDIAIEIRTRRNRVKDLVLIIDSLCDRMEI